MNAAIKIPRQLLKFSDDETAQQKDDREHLEAAEKRLRDSQSPFQIGFGRILNSAEMTACERLRDAIATIDKSGNASMSYDGAAVDSFSYGSKTISDRVVEASHYKRRCEMAVVADVQMFHHDAWKVFTRAIEAELNAQQAGDMICQMRKDKMGKHKRRDLAVEIIQASASAIRDITY